MTDKQIIIEDCPYFIGGNCQEYLDGVCENHKCDLKIIRELEEKLSNKRKECDELHETVKSQKEEIKNLNYTLYEERSLTTDLAKANLKISALKRDLSSARNRFKNENQQNKEIIKSKEQECEELKTMLKDLSYENQKFCYQIEEQTKQLEPFKDEYFKGLDNVVIAELAKKSIRITAENCKLEQTLTEIKEIAITGLEGFCPKCSRKECEDNNCIETAIRDILQKISEVENG